MILLPISLTCPACGSCGAFHFAVTASPQWRPFCWTRASVTLAVFLYVHFANCYPESSQSPTNSHFCSFEPERYHRGALSSFNHFPQLLVLVGPPTAESGAARTHSTNRITRRLFIRSSAWTISGLSSTASRRSTVRAASRGYSPKMRLASSTARASVSWSGLFITVRNSTKPGFKIGGGIFVPLWRCGFLSRRLSRRVARYVNSRVGASRPPARLGPAPPSMPATPRPYARLSGISSKLTKLILD